MQADVNAGHQQHQRQQQTAEERSVEHRIRFVIRPAFQVDEDVAPNRGIEPEAHNRKIGGDDIRQGDEAIHGNAQAVYQVRGVKEPNPDHGQVIYDIGKEVHRKLAAHA